MKTHNPDNERIKRAYFTYLIEAQGFSDPTLDSVAKAINRFETYTRFRDFKAFHIEQAKGFQALIGITRLMCLIAEPDCRFQLIEIAGSTKFRRLARQVA
jgi:hypothetical protein